MPLSYHVDEESGILYWNADGVDSETEWNEQGRQAIGLLNSTPGLRALIDHRSHQPTTSNSFIKTVISWIDPVEAEVDAKWALVVSSEVNYGIARMASTYCELKGIQVKIFTDPESAEIWLKGP
jgi:hypothetical protein